MLKVTAVCKQWIALFVFTLFEKKCCNPQKTLEAINNKIWPEMFNKIHFKDFMHKWRASFALSMFNWINQGRNGGHIWHYEHSNYYLLCMRFSRISRMSSESEEIWSWAINSLQKTWNPLYHHHQQMTIQTWGHYTHNIEIKLSLFCHSAYVCRSLGSCCFIVHFYCHLWQSSY